GAGGSRHPGLAVPRQLRTGDAPHIVPPLDWWGGKAPSASSGRAHRAAPSLRAGPPPSPTAGYTVAMPVVSIRFARDDVHERLKQAATRSGVAMSPLAELFIDEGFRMDNHPLRV